MQRPTIDFPEHASETAGVWDSLAEWWDDTIGDGNATQDLLIEPAQERLLALAPDEEVLDIACGAGRFTRRMARAGARIVAVDHSERFLARASRVIHAMARDSRQAASTSRFTSSRP